MRKALWFIVLPAVLLIGGYFYLRYTLQSAIKHSQKVAGEKAKVPDTLSGKKVGPADLRPLFIKRLQQIVKRSSNGLYNVSIADLQVDVLAGSVLLRGVQLKPDSTVADSLREVH